MAMESNKALSRRVLELWASDNDGVFEEILADHYISHQEPYVAGDVSDMDLAGYKALVTGFHEGFGESSVRFLMQIAEDDHVATRWEITATHTGDYLGHAPTHRTTVWTGIQIDRHADGKIIESWVDWDKYRFLDMLGLIGGSLPPDQS